MKMRFAITVYLFTLFAAACAPLPESTVAESPRLSFIHLNDTYRVGAVEDGTRGGFGRVVTVIRELQDEGREVRTLHGGDFLYPSLESQLWNGLQMIDAMNYLDALAPMIVAPGNHEFDRRTPAPLVNAMRASNFDWLADNVVLDTGDADIDAALRKAFTFRAAGKTIGVFSLSLHADDGGNRRDYVSIGRNYRATAERVIAELEQKGVDAIIGLTHLHLRQDVELASLRAAHPKLAFIVGGHEHEPQYVAGSEVAAAVMKGASNARAIWRIDLDFDAAGRPVVSSELLQMDDSVAIDDDYRLLSEKWRARLLDKFPFLEARIGRAAFPMDAREETVRTEESAWANVTVDPMLTAFGEPRADFAFINSGSLRIDDYVAGDITFEDVARTFGFSSFLRYMTMRGADFRRLMEAGFRGDGTSQGFFPQIAGFRVCVDRSRPAGSRIVSMQVPGGEGWQEIDPDAEYTVVMPDFLYRGGDGYRVPAGQVASRPGSERKYLVLDAILRAQAAGRAIGTPVDPDNPRIDLDGGSDQGCF